MISVWVCVYVEYAEPKLLFMGVFVPVDPKFTIDLLGEQQVLERGTEKAISG